MPQLDELIEEIKNTEGEERRAMVRLLLTIISEAEVEGAGVAA